jgi:hypothetical protein
MGREEKDWVTLREFSWLPEALVLRSRLEDAGIPSLIPEENTVRINSGMTGMQVRVLVPGDREAEARALLADCESAPAESETCPQCGSRAIERRSVKVRNGLRALLGLLFLIPMRPRSGPRSCRDCGKSF